MKEGEEIPKKSNFEIARKNIIEAKIVNFDDVVVVDDDDERNGKIDCHKNVVKKYKKVEFLEEIRDVIIDNILANNEIENKEKSIELSKKKKKIIIKKVRKGKKRRRNEFESTSIKEFGDEAHLIKDPVPKKRMK